MSSSELKKYAIIVAGGSGSRMQAAQPKQFLPIGGEPVLMHTLRRFHAFDPTMPLVLVLPQAEVKTWQGLCGDYSFTLPHQVVVGGTSRFQSVKNGLAALDQEQDGVVAVHDGVRPFVDNAILQAAYNKAFAQGTAVVAVSLKDSIRRVRGGSSKAVDRSAYRLVQTPQCFRLPLLRRAYAQPESPLFTDDASVVERFGHKIHLVEGSFKNIKLTTPEDLLLAEAFLQQEKNQPSAEPLKK
ncbi:2-C-methyl-D-erythritol 4-phosphate cytidylyltransferase [Rufibacter radiotolerans]|uniref:2-C-methyl-D-erythritol 4-phosphate cytidylyltransferase n=1 Tax=Rufibacter radiotolerans TaxID=1379910 RepID=A0A0H4VNB8_9BACT|nr:2-C-methyl-D-erythritol 4-phosphate cytidylyltransferase [Rufibacter radiotolerans]AKQ46808.1 2-C-methyl-D-erythritol 4-phosphate cytidylyltransferase [Rufibacter radiotolerans]